ncbi:MAG TPA: class I SAM-dependent methyltransferase, partial [Bacteroidetes bacterium]|nr:class I SAM-dependent methyltransferase [Bacteroidota bacterium]
MIQKKVLAAYEQLAHSYNQRIDHKPHNAYYDRPNTLGLLPEISGTKILDAGCGPGKYTEILLEKGAEVHSFDLSPKMIEEAQKRNGNRGKFFLHDLTQPLIQYQDGVFDVVLCALALDYIPDWTQTIVEFNRLLRPEGVVVASFGHPFFEFNYFSAKQYFSTEPVKTIWRGFGEPVEMHSYRRSLEECLLPFTNNGFYIDRLIEPKPTKEFAKFDERHYLELSVFPS